MKYYRTNGGHTPPDTIFILLLLCVFAFASFMSAAFGANAYARICDQKELHLERVTPLSYIASKVRQSDGAGSLRTEQKDDIEALVLSSDEGGELCETWIYVNEGSLCELFISAGTPFDPGAGTPILDSEGLSFTLEEGVLRLESRGAGEAVSTLTLVPRGAAAQWNKVANEEKSGGVSIE